jgi:hypothetical protein
VEEKKGYEQEQAKPFQSHFPQLEGEKRYEQEKSFQDQLAQMDVPKAFL